MTDPSTQSARTAASTAEQFACHAARLLADSRCERVLALDLRGLSPVADFFVIATGTSDRQTRSAGDDLAELARQEGRAMFGRQGGPTGRWVVCDFVDVVVHLFDESLRAYYDLESLWADAPKVDWQAATRPGQFVHLWRGRSAGT